jgi:hypothetical protein
MCCCVRVIKIGLTLKKKSIMKKPTKTLQMSFLVGALFSTSLLAQGQGWDFTYLAPSSYSGTGVFFTYGRGKYEKAYDNEGTVVPLLSLYGPTNVPTLLLDSSSGSGNLAQSSTISAHDYNILSTITNEGLGASRNLVAEGNVAFNDFVFGAGLKINKAISLVATLPVFRYTFTHKGVTDLTPAEYQSPNWVAFIKSYKNILAGYGLKTESYTENAIGDLQFSVVLENLLDTVESFDIKARLGVIIPTATKERLDHVFTVDYGHRKQFGGLFGLTITSLTSDYFQLQAGGNVIMFAEGTETVRMYTDERQSGFVKLAQGAARQSVGNVWNAFGTFTVTTPNSPVSLLMGYACNGQSDTVLHPEDQSAFKTHIVNRDPRLKKWLSHTVFTEMLFVKKASNKYCEEYKLSLLVDYPLAGKNTVKGVRYGGSCGVALQFDF